MQGFYKVTMCNNAILVPKFYEGKESPWNISHLVLSECDNNAYFQSSSIHRVFCCVPRHPKSVPKVAPQPLGGRPWGLLNGGNRLSRRRGVMCRTGWSDDPIYCSLLKKGEIVGDVFVFLVMGGGWIKKSNYSCIQVFQLWIILGCNYPVIFHHHSGSAVCPNTATVVGNSPWQDWEGSSENVTPNAIEVVAWKNCCGFGFQVPYVL